MHSFQIFPIAKLDYFLEVILCTSLSQMGEHILDFELEEDDTSAFILNKSEPNNSNKIGTLLFLKPALDSGAIAHQSARAGNAMARIMAGLNPSTGNIEKDTAVFDTEAANVSQEVFAQIINYLESYVPEFA